jgi:hypothetical protein
MFFSKNFQNFGQKHKGDQGNFFEFLKKFQNHFNLLFFRADRHENFFTEKHLFLSGKPSEIIDFRRKFC